MSAAAAGQSNIISSLAERQQISYHLATTRPASSSCRSSHMLGTTNMRRVNVISNWKSLKLFRKFGYCKEAGAWDISYCTSLVFLFGFSSFKELINSEPIIVAFKGNLVLDWIFQWWWQFSKSFLVAVESFQLGETNNVIVCKDA